MKKILYKLREFKTDILTTVLTVLVILLTGYLLSENSKNIIQILATFVGLFFIIRSRTADKEFIFSALTSRKDKDNWIGSGIFQFSRVHGAYELTYAERGYIHQKLLDWSDYKLSFEFKISSFYTDGGLGIIVRADNLANYIMLQIKERGIAPHIRVNGAWAIWQPEDCNLLFPQKIGLDSWYKCEVHCDKNTITVGIFEKDHKIFDRIWEIPQGALTVEYTHSNEYPITRYPFPIALEYGSIGFRNWEKEKSFIKNVLVEKL